MKMFKLSISELVGVLGIKEMAQRDSLRVRLFHYKVTKRLWNLNSDDMRKLYAGGAI